MAFDQAALSVAVVEDPKEWLVMRTKPRQERIATNHLAQRGVEPYCPMFIEPPWHPRAPKGPMPLFAGYLFVRCAMPRDYNAVRFCSGILGPVSFARFLATVSDDFIDALRMREGDRGHILPEDLQAKLQKGQKVRVVGGPLAGLSGVFSGYLRGGQRARVLAELLRTQRLVEVDAQSIAPARV